MPRIIPAMPNLNSLVLLRRDDRLAAVTQRKSSYHGLVYRAGCIRPPCNSDESFAGAYRKRPRLESGCSRGHQGSPNDHQYRDDEGDDIHDHSRDGRATAFAAFAVS